MSLALEKRSEASIASIQQNITDHKAVARELQQARETIASHEQEILRLRHIITKQNNDLATKEADKCKLQYALDAVVKELSATKAAVGDVQGHNTRLRRDLERWSPAAGAGAASAAAGFGGNTTAACGAPPILRNYNSPTTTTTTGVATSPLTPSRPSTEQRSRAAPRTPIGSGSTINNGNLFNKSPSLGLGAEEATGMAADGSRSTASYGNLGLSPHTNKSDTIKTENNTNNNTATFYQPQYVNRGGGGVSPTQQHSNSATTTAASSAAGSNNNAPLPLYLQKCLDCDVSPHPLVVKSLYKLDGTLIAGDAVEPIRYGQLLPLVETLNQRRFVSPVESLQSLWGPPIARMEIVCADDEARGIAATLIECAAFSLTYLLIAEVTDRVAAPIAGAIAVSPCLASLELPNLKVSDEGMQLLMKVVANRDAAAAASRRTAATSSPSHGGGGGAMMDATMITLGASSAAAQTPSSPLLGNDHSSPYGVGAPIAVADLDLSQTHLSEADTFFLIKGAFIHSISFKNCSGLLDNFLGEVLLSSPNLHTLDLSNCTSLTQDAVLFLNRAPNLRKLTLANNVGLHNLRLNTVVELSTDFRGVTHFVAPQLERFVSPLQSFSCVSFECPKLAEITIANTTLSQREFSLLGECSALSVAQFVNCRTNGGFSHFLKRMRRLSKLSVRCCKGITDTDIDSIGVGIIDLDLTECYCLTDKLAQKIGAVCKNLRRLTLKRCSGVSDTGLYFLAQCPELEFLNVLGMRKVTDEGLRRVVEQQGATSDSLRHVIHETFVSTVIRVDRTDDEEVLRHTNVNEERAVLLRRQNAALSYNSRAPIASLTAEDLVAKGGRGGGARSGGGSPSQATLSERYNGWSSNVRQPLSDNDVSSTAVDAPTNVVAEEEGTPDSEKQADAGDAVAERSTQEQQQEAQVGDEVGVAPLSSGDTAAAEDLGAAEGIVPL